MKTDFAKYATLRMNVRGRKEGLEDFLDSVNEDQHSFQSVKDARAKFEVLKELTDIIEKLDEDESKS